MKLKEDVDLILLFKTVQSCYGEVFFCSAEGDKLNLKSTLSQYLFSALINRKDLLATGRIVCDEQGDIPILSEFCETD